MLSVRATYDGKKLKLCEKVAIRTPREVIVTFLDPVETNLKEDELSGVEIGKMVQEGGALDFLDDKEEDIYSDADLKVKY